MTGKKQKSDENFFRDCSTNKQSDVLLIVTLASAKQQNISFSTQLLLVNVKTIIAPL